MAQFSAVHHATSSNTAVKIGVDCVSLPAGLAIVPSTPHSQEVLSQCLRRVRYFVPNGFFQSRRNQPKIRVHSCEICHCSNQSNWIELQPGRPSHYGNSSNSSRASRFPVRFGRFVMRGEPTRNAKVSRCPVPILPYLDWPYWLCAKSVCSRFPKQRPSGRVSGTSRVVRALLHPFAG